MKVLLVTLIVFLTVNFAQGLTCYSCPLGSNLSSCVTGHATASCLQRCMTMKFHTTKSNEQQVTYLEKLCGFDLFCEPDVSKLCKDKNSSIIAGGDVMHNCTARCCATNLCNNDDLPKPPTSVGSIAFSASVGSIASSASGGSSASSASVGSSIFIDASVSSVAVLTDPPVWKAPTKPCDAASINNPLRFLTLSLSAVFSMFHM